MSMWQHVRSWIARNLSQIGFLHIALTISEPISADQRSKLIIHEKIHGPISSPFWA
jgi:hypothetical protein